MAPTETAPSSAPIRDPEGLDQLPLDFDLSPFQTAWKPVRRALSLFVFNLPLILGLVALLYGPLFALLMGAAKAGAFGDSPEVHRRLVAVVSAIGLLLLGPAVIYGAVHGLRHEALASPIACLRWGLRCLAPMLWAGVVSSVLIQIGDWLFVIPGLILVAVFTLVVPIVAVEGPRQGEVLRRCFELTRGRILAILLAWLIAAALFTPFGGVMGVLEKSFPGWIGLSLGGAVLAVYFAFIVCLTFSIYLARVRPGPDGFVPVASRSRLAWLNLSGAVIVVIGIVLLLGRSVVLDWYEVPSGSMMPAIEVGDRMLVDKAAYAVRVPFSSRVLWQRAEPVRGEMVVFVQPVDGRTDSVKRVVGLPGDVIEIRDDLLHVNGKPVSRSPADPAELELARWPEAVTGYWEELERVRYRVLERERSDFGPVTVPEGQYFMLADHRDNASDSRAWGTVPRDHLRGRVMRVFDFATWLTLLGDDGLR